MRASEYKPLLFTTTVRNPQRLKALLNIFAKFDGQILTNDLATQIVCELICYGLYRPMVQSESIKNKWATTLKGEFAEVLLTNKEVEYIFEHNPQDHKQAGFAKGYPSRFATFFNFAKELGFVYYQPNELIEFSEIGKKFANIFSVKTENGNIIVTEEHPEYEQQAFLQAMAKSQRNNPFVRVLNENIPLILLLETIKKLNADPEFNNAGISRKELPLLIFWKDNNAEVLYQRIKKLREEYRYNPSDEVIIDICTTEILPNFKKFKPKSIVSEYPDEFIRKMRLTGLISLRGAGRFIDINHNEDERVEYVLEHYSHYQKYTTERAYFDYMAQIDENLFAIAPIVADSTQNERLLQNWVTTYDWSSIKSELRILSTRSKVSKDEILKFLPNPVRLEFLTALAIKSKMPEVRVIPNYPCDDEGLPTSTAGGVGDKGDIECFEKSNSILVEVTMAEGRVQTTMEVWPITRHLEAFRNRCSPNSQCIFIAPSIFRDSERQINWIRSQENLAIRSYKIEDFISYLETENMLYDPNY
ncbi:MAG: AlwI family type II restriction endonuclease [Bacteroidales bacterium]|nr:AlwI family type II restriction endonuclease [Bacteroidales bacterium]